MKLLLIRLIWNFYVKIKLEFFKIQGDLTFKIKGNCFERIKVGFFL